MLDKLQTRICKTVDPMIDVSLEPMANHRNVGSLSLFFMYYFERYSSELAEMVPFPYSQVKSIRYSNRLHDFLSPSLEVRRMPMPTVSFFEQLDAGNLCL